MEGIDAPASETAADAVLALAAIEALPSGVIIVDREERVLYANGRSADLFKRPVGELKKMRLAAFLAPIDQLLSIQEKGRSTSERSEIAVRLPDRTSAIIGFTVSPLGGSAGGAGREQKYICVLQDISGYITLRKERDALLRRAVVGELLPSILHELKNPLAGMTTAVELLLEEVSDENIQRDLKGIFKEIRRLDLGMQGFAVAGRDLRSPDMSDVGEAIREAVRILVPIAQDARVNLTAKADDLPPIKLNADVVRGLVFNMVQSSMSSCGANGTVKLEALIKGDDFELSVEDNGSTALPSVSDTSPGGRIGRVGIALLMCKRSCETAGGTLKIGETSRGGTSMMVRVPQVR